jgi:hypothetical protein
VKKLLEFIQNNKQDYNINIVGNIFSYHNFEMLLAGSTHKKIKNPVVIHRLHNGIGDNFF